MYSVYCILPIFGFVKHRVIMFIGY